MRILHLRASNFYGGPERQLHLHALEARDCGYAMTVSSFVENGRPPEFLQVIAKDGIDTHAFDVKNPYDPSAIRILRRYLAQNEFNVLCTHDYRAHLIGFLASRGTDAKWVAFSRGWTAENLKVSAYHAIEKVLIRFADHIVAVSESQKKKLERLLVPGRVISVVHNAIDGGKLSGAEPVNLREKFNIGASAIICVAAGRFSREKGQLCLVRASQAVAAANDRIYFILFGDGPDLPRVRNAIARQGLQNKVFCPGFERDFIGCLKGADILVNPSLSEGLPNIVLEGMALGVPVIATAVGGVPELVRHNENGILVNPGDGGALSKAILDLVKRWPERERLTRAAMETVRNTFSFKKQMSDLDRIYRMVKGDRGN